MTICGPVLGSRFRFIDPSHFVICRWRKPSKTNFLLHFVQINSWLPIISSFLFLSSFSLEYFSRHSSHAYLLLACLLSNTTTKSLEQKEQVYCFTTFLSSVGESFRNCPAKSKSFSWASRCFLYFSSSKNLR